MEEGVVLPVAGEALEVPEQDAVGGVGAAALGAGGVLPAVVDEVVEGLAADDGAAGAGLVGKDLDEDQVVALAVLLGHAALLVDGALLLVAARVAEVADDARARREWALVGHDPTLGRLGCSSPGT